MDSIYRSSSCGVRVYKCAQMPPKFCKLLPVFFALLLQSVALGCANEVIHSSLETIARRVVQLQIDDHDSRVENVLSELEGVSWVFHVLASREPSLYQGAMERLSFLSTHSTCEVARDAASDLIQRISTEHMLSEHQRSLWQRERLFAAAKFDKGAYARFYGRRLRGSSSSSGVHLEGPTILSPTERLMLMEPPPTKFWNSSTERWNKIPTIESLPEIKREKISFTVFSNLIEVAADSVASGVVRTKALERAKTALMRRLVVLEKVPQKTYAVQLGYLFVLVNYHPLIDWKLAQEVGTMLIHQYRDLHYYSDHDSLWHEWEITRGDVPENFPRSTFELMKKNRQF